VPRDATSGPITVRNTLGNAESAPIPVVSYRNRDGFNFANYASQQPYGFGDLEIAYGREQTYWLVDTCWYAPLYSCYSLKPNPFVVAFAAAIADLANGGLCFGLGLASIRLREGWEPLRDYRPVPKDPPPKTLEEAAEEDRRRPKSAWEIKKDLRTDRLVRRMHLYQVSKEVNELRDHEAESPAGFRDRLWRELRNEDPVLITFEDGNSGHAIVAYDLVDYAPGRFDIVAYDPNRPYDTGEEGDTISAARAHRDDEEGSNLRVFERHLVVSVLRLVRLDGQAHDAPPPIHSADPEAVLNAPKISLALATGAGRIAQVTNAAGKTLLRPSGDNNLKAFPGAVVLAPLDRREGPNPTILLPVDGKYDVTVGGRRAGSYTAGFLNGRLSALVQASTRSGAADRVTLDGRAGTLTFAAGAERRSPRPSSPDRKAAPRGR
jgi:hypothetical protein